MKSFDRIKFQISWRLKETKARINLLLNKNIVVVYTMGKVGSTSIYHSLNKQLKGNVIFTHRMVKENIKKYNSIFLRKNQKPHRTRLGEILFHQIPHKKLKIITLVREPIGRNLSDFFQDLPVYFSDYKNINNYSNAIILKHFMAEYQHDIPLLWFDDEFKETTGINVFQHKFNTRGKYQIIKKKNIEVLVIRADLEDVKKEKVIGEFLTIPDFRIERKNTAKAKYYAQKYSDFIAHVKLEKDYIDRLMTSAFCLHFFSEEEINKLKNNYLNR